MGIESEVVVMYFCEFDENHVNKILMCGVSNHQATKIKCMKVINTNKSRKQREKERDNTKDLIYQFGSKLN